MATFSISPQPQLAPPPFSSSSSKTYTYQYDCSYGLCTFDCPQWCILPPPPPLFLNSDDPTTSSDAATHFSPLMAALIAVLAASFCLLFYFTVFSNFFHNRRNRNHSHHSSSLFIDDRVDALVAGPTQSGSGLDDAFIRQITVFKYFKEDKLIDATECAVCLSEFNEGDNLRLMPNCEHAFHVPCIDTWLKSHSNCPLCRSTMNPVPIRVSPITTTSVGLSGSNNTNSNPSNPRNDSNNNNSNVSVAALRVERRSNDVVLVVREVNNQVQVVGPAHGVGVVGSVNLDERESKLYVNNGNDTP